MTNNIGERIKKLRVEMRMSVDELATLIGKNRATIYRYEKNNIENVPYTALIPIAQALHTTPAYLMGWDDEPDNLEVLKDLLSKNNLTLNDFTKEELSKIVEYSLFLYNQRK